MSWPLSQDYNEAIQSPASNFADPDLQRGEAACNALGLPMPYSGNFADVYQVRCPDGGRWAVKCFTREAVGLRERYLQISDHLRQAKLPFMVDFSYLDRGIRVAGKWYPALKMQWVEGLTLNQFVGQYLDRPAMLEALAQVWAKMAKYLRSAEVGHCDLQHGNVLLVPGPDSHSLKLKLIDYDGMWVPALAGTKSGEVGHANYQHPRRLREGTYSLEVDRFPLLLVVTALRALKARKSLWERYDNGDNLLFKELDLRNPAQSSVFQELAALPDSGIALLATHVRAALVGGLETTPLLEEVTPEARPSAAASSRPPRLRPAATPVVAPVAPVAPVAVEALTFDEPSAEAYGSRRQRGGKKSAAAAMRYRIIAIAAAAVVVLVLVGGFAVWAMSGSSNQSKPAKPDPRVVQEDPATPPPQEPNPEVVKPPDRTPPVEPPVDPTPPETPPVVKSPDTPPVLKLPEAAPPVVKPSDPAPAPPDPAIVEAMKVPFAGRAPGELHDKLVKFEGGTDESEAAVARGLLWLALHQVPDGHWSLNDFQRFAHKTPRPDTPVFTDSCTGQVARRDDIAGTGFGLLPFLAGGFTHKPNKVPKQIDYSRTVKAGLNYLIREQGKDGFFGGSMYSHGLCTIAMCEAYGMTSDPMLKMSAQRAINYIVAAQDPAGGGWRYSPREPGDTSVTGWQLMALKTGHMAGLSVPKETSKKTEHFLDAVGGADGGYSYLPGSGATPVMTAVGMLCRLHLGADPHDPGLLKGVDYLKEDFGPSKTRNIYYEYYATQVMHHMGGDAWNNWNKGRAGDGNGGIRDILIARQTILADPAAKLACENGSWAPDGPWGADGGGRIMFTSLSLLTLEVYYRYPALWWTAARAESRKPLTNSLGRFAAFVNEEGCQTEAEQTGDKKTCREPGFDQDEQTNGDPVVELAGSDATRSCQGLSKKET